MDFKIKIDLSNQSIINETPKKKDKKRKKDKERTGDKSGKSRKKVSSSDNKAQREIKESKDHKEHREHPSTSKDKIKEPHSTGKKKKYHRRSDKKGKENENDKPKINSNSIISLTLPYNENLKGDQAQKLSMITKKKPRHWEKRWVLIPNVFEFTKEIWLKKWVLVDGGEDIVDNNNYLQQYYSNHIKPYKEMTPKKYQCSFDECGKIFFDASSLRKHLLTHGERHFICKHEGCGKKFLDNSKLRRHQLVHTGEKPFKCDLCGKKFSLDFNLKTHLRTHTGEKPYICSFTGCDKRFTQSSNLTAHEKTHKEQAAGIVAANGTQAGVKTPDGKNSINATNPNILSPTNGKPIFTSIKEEQEEDEISQHSPEINN